MVWSTDADDAKVLLNIPFPMNYVTIDQFALNLVDIFPGNTLHVSCKSLLKSLHFILAQSGNSIIATACPLKSG